MSTSGVNIYESADAFSFFWDLPEKITKYAAGFLLRICPLNIPVAKSACYGPADPAALHKLPAVLFHSYKYISKIYS